MWGVCNHINKDVDCAVGYMSLKLRREAGLEYEFWSHLCLNGST